MKVLQSGLSNDRTENYVLSGLHAAGIDVHVVCSENSMGHALCKELSVTHHVHDFQSRIDRTAIRLLREMIAEHDYDIIHSYTNRALSNVLLATRGRPIKHVGYRGTMGHLSRFDPAAWMTYFNRRVDKIVCVSGAVEQYLKNCRVANHRLTTIHKGHDPDWYQHHTPASLAEFGIPEHAFVIGFVGNMRPVKGVDVLLEAIRHLPADSPIHLLLVGEVRDPRVARLAGHPDVAPRVHFAGFRTDAPALAGACQILTMPSVDREGLPRVLLEGMSQGIPAVVSNVGGMPELIEQEISGLIVPPRDSQALAAAFQRLASHPNEVEHLGIAARERINGPFHVRHTLEKTIKLYTELSSSPTTPKE